MDDFNVNLDRVKQIQNKALDDYLKQTLPLSWPGVDPTTNIDYTSARTWVAPRVDPLILDLDGDGIETVGIRPGAAVLFDHDGDGTRTGSGWVKADDGILVLDLDGNGRIDSGRELFGDQTLLQSGPNAGQRAASGFAALAQYDANADGRIDSADALYSQLQVWQDLNQDGISQSNELKTLGQLGIASIQVSGTARNTALIDATTGMASGNTLQTSGSFTRVDGSVGVSGDLLLASNNFYREFTDEPVVTQEAQVLPQMQGSGWVRDLREAMSLGSSAAQALQATAAQFAGGTTQAQQLAQLDALLGNWAASSGRLVDSTQTYNLAVVDGNYVTADLNNFGSTSLYLTVHVSGMETTVPAVGGGTWTELTPQGQEVLRRMNVLEVFNGTKFYQIPVGNPNTNGVTAVANTGTSSGAAAPIGGVFYSTTLSTQQIDLINQSYDALKASVYGALVVQTRLKPYLDSIELVIDETGVRFDTTAMVAMVQGKVATDTLNAVADLIDMKKHAGTTVQAIGWEPYKTLAGILETVTITPEIQSLLTADRIVSLGATGTNLTVSNAAGATVLGNASANTLNGGAGADKLYGQGGNDTLVAAGNGDLLDGGAGDDTLSLSSSSNSDTTFIGGTGNDTLNGSYYNDLYLFNLGDGQDTINDYTPYGGYTDVLRLGAGIAAADVTPVRSGLDLIFKVGAGSDQVTVKNWFANAGNAYQIERIEFADGTVWSNTEVNTRALVVTGTAGADSLTGVTAFVDKLYGQGGNDTLVAAGNGDLLDGGAGDDTLSLSSSSNSDTTFIGGTGNDTLNGSYYNDLYLFNLGDGQDTINDYTPYGGYTDVLRLGAGIAAADVTPVRSGLDLIFKVGAGSDQVTVKNWFANAGNAYQIERIEFADGTVWSAAAVTATAQSTAGVVLSGSGTLQGTQNDDTLTGTGLGTRLIGGAGNDTLKTVHNTGTAWDNVFEGGQGNDILEGSYARDTYLFNRGDGQDTITDDVRFYPNAGAPDYFAAHPGDASYQDRIKFGAGIAADQLWFRQDGNSLEISVIGSSDKVKVNGWYDSFFNEIEEFQLASGQMLLNENVNNLVQAMAAFAPPSAGQTTLSASYATALAPVIAANWQ